jgi:DNA-binding SARP family transcriptional activator
LVAPFEQVPIIEMIEVAARRLARAIATLDPSPGPVQWLRAGRDGVEVRFSAPLPDALEGWHRTAPANWLLSVSADSVDLDRVRADAPWCPVLLPLGDDERGTWIVPIGTGMRVSVIGPRAADLALAMRAAASTWSWHEGIAIVDDAHQADEIVHGAAQHTQQGQAAGPHILFVGDPGALAEATRRACSVLATCQVDDAEVTVIADERAASAHPLGLTLRPPLLDSAWKEAVDALIGRGSPGIRGSTQPLVRHSAPPAVLRVAEPAACDRRGAPGSFVSPDASALEGERRERLLVSESRHVEVQLLTTVPGIVGLQADLPPKRARRAVELIAYLAMHSPEPVTGERLRMRVLGSADADAAAKTLFNTVSAARHALGSGPDGKPLLPPASRSGHYHLSSAVTVDALRASALLRDGLAAQDPVERLRHLREGLELVSAEPLAGVLTGYAWWRAEGHERRVADVVVDGACALVRTALGSGDIDMARWALGQARKVEPYSEALTRAAMRVAAESGDVRRLHAEWRECQRQVDELDPGGTPSERTEQLYAILRSQLTGERGHASFAAIDAAPLSTVPSAPSTV